MFEMKISEIKKAEAAANKYLGRKDCKVTGYFAKKATDIGAGEWYDVICEICFNYEERADIDVRVSVFMADRRRSFATVVPNHAI
ncbi:MAG: hypothetical protein ACI4PO_09230 [Faecousia sp.]